ncbi:MAG: peptidyl-prolyl cis-trans isomerase [Candidatus Hydrogenedentes bacterium]|nr:peptidyl-prolyl cis-trans isomerase [Candidatus Hydrogenedentota bacterium]
MVSFTLLFSRRLFLLVLAMFLAVGCGQITDKDRIKVAKIGEKYITRGKLFKLIREMPDAKRPIIRNRSDLLRILNQHIDSRIKLPLGRKLAAAGKVKISRDHAREQFFLESGDEAKMLRNSWTMEVPPSGVVTPLMKIYGLTPELLQFNKDNVDEGTDRVLEKMQGDKAVEYLAAAALKEGRITLDSAEIQREYKFMKEQLVSYEEITFIGIRFPSTLGDASAQAAKVLEEINGGIPFDDILKEYAEKGTQENIGYIMQSDISNNPALEKFRGFWSAASGAEKGAIIGPVYLPAYQQVVEDKDGNTRAINMPDAYLILKVLDHRPEHVMSFEEAKSLAAAPLLKAKMMHLLRDEKGVEVYEDKLPEPSQTQGPTVL